MAEFIVCFGSDDEKKENKRKKAPHHTYNQYEKKKKNKQKYQKEEMNDKNIIKNEKEKEEKMKIAKGKIYSEDFIEPNLLKIEKSPQNFAEELDFGNTEYKLKLCGINNQKLAKRITQMKFRLREGNGECHYYIGVEDDGNPLGISEKEMEISIETIEKMVSEIENAKITKIDYLKGQNGLISEITINRNILKENDNNINKYNQNYEELKIGLIGEENSGKSTLVGCLISDKKDNGNGLTRTNVFKHRHEINCGKTSSFTHQIMGFDKSGKKTNINDFGNLNSWSVIVNNSEKIINFIDMGGSEKSLNNSLKTLSNNYLDYIVLSISVDKGITNNTLLFLDIIFKLYIPLIVVFTKIDLINENDRSNVLYIFGKVLKKFKCGKNPLVVKNKEDIVMFSSNMNEGIIPIFLISNKTGEGLDYINNFFSILPNKENDMLNNKNNDDINEILNMRFDFLKIHKDEEGKKNNIFIVEGIVTQGKILSNENYNLGPFNEKDNSFIKVKVLSIHCKKMTVQNSIKGQFCSLEILLEKENNLYDKIRNGMVLIGNKVPQISCKKFKIELWSLKSIENDIKIKKSYQPLIHLEHISQVCKFIVDEKENEIIIPCDKSIIIDVEFIYYPEYVRKDSYIIILDNYLKLYGAVREVYT